MSVATDGNQATAEGILQNTEAIDESIITSDFADRHTKAEITEDKCATPDSMECGPSKVLVDVAVEESDASLPPDHLKIKAVNLGPEVAETPTEDTSVSELSIVQDECIANEPSASESDFKETISPASETEINETYPKASTGEREPDISPCEGMPPNEDRAGSDNEGPNAFEHKFEVVSDIKSLTSPVSNEVSTVDGNGGVCEKIVESCRTDCNKSSEVTQSGVESVVQSSDKTGSQHVVGNSSDFEVAQDSTGFHQPTSTSQQLVAKMGEDINSEAEVLEEKNPQMNDDTVKMDRKPEPVTLCPLCMKTFNQPLDVHLAEFHICNHFIPAKRTQAYKLHMLQRVKDISRVTEAIDTQEFVYVCRSCQFASKDINAVRFHVNIHEDVYQAIPGKISCECNQRKYSYPFHKWKHLLHCSTYECMICNFYFACEKGLLNHLHALHFSEGTCNSCKMEVTQDSMLAHACLTSCKNDSETLDLEPEESNINFRFGLSWNTLDNYINYLDGKDFRLNTSSKLMDPNLDRSYLKFPIKNVLSEAVVPDEVKLDPGKDIGKYMKGKKNIKLTLSEESYGIVKNFHLSVQFDLEKKLGRKGRRGQGFIPRAKREDDLFDVLGLGTIRSRGSTRQELGDPSNSPRTKKGRSRAKQEANKEESDSHGQDLPSLTRTRSGMQPVREGDDKIYETPGPQLEPGIVIDGEWTKNHTYICCSCGAGYLDLADMMDHKWESHPSVWCAHTMIQGQGDVPASFCRQYQPPTSQPPKLPLPGTTPKQTPSSTPSRRNSDANTPTPAEKPQYVCSLCKLEFQERTTFHAHLVECGGLNHVASSKKKNKKGFRFKRRKGQGVPSNRYGNSSQPGTPLKAKPGDRSSGLNTPQLDRTSQGAFQSSGVKRRLELAVGSIDNAELKNRLKAIITGSRKTTGNVAGMSSRRTIRMKLRKKALETKRLRKTRHSDRVKENVSKQQEKGKEEGGKEEKKGKEEGIKTQAKKGKEETAREEEKEEENSAKGKKVKVTKNIDGSGESSMKDKEKKDKVVGGKSLKDDNGDSENDSAKKITRRRGSAEQPKQSKKAKSVNDKVGMNQKVMKKKQTKGESSEPVPNIKELSTKSTSETVDVSNNLKVTKKKTKYRDVNKEVLLEEKRLQALKKMNGIVGLSDRELQPVCKIKELKSKTKVPGSKVGRKPLNQNPGGQVIAEVNSQKKISDKKEQTAKKNIENIRKSGIGKVTMLTGKKIKGSRALSDLTIVKVAKKMSKKKQIAMETGVPMEKEIVVPLSTPAEEKDVLVQKKGVKAKKYLTEKKIALNTKRSAVPEKFNTDEESGESQERNLKYNTVKAPETSELYDMKLNKEPVKKSVYLISSSEETEDESDDSEPEVSRNFRTGRRCGGRMGLRNKRKPQNQRYSFRSCLDPEETENDKDETEIVKDSTVLETKVEETKEELPLTPKRKRKIANYEDDDDFTYMPSGNSTDLEEESSDGIEESEREISTSLRKRRKTTVMSSDSEGRKPARRATLQRRGSTLTSEGETFDDAYDENATKPINTSLYLDVSKNSKVLIEGKIPKKKNMRLQCLVSQAMKSEENLERLGQKGSKKNSESNQSGIGSSEDERKTSGKLRVRKLPNTTDDSQESESTVDDDCVGKATSVPVPTKRKKTTKKPVLALTPLVETSLANNIRKYDDDDDDDDDEDNLPLATIAQLKGRSLPRRIAMSNIIKEKVKSVAVKSRKLTSGVQKHLPRQVMDTGTADSESSGFEGFVPVSIKKNKRRIGLKHKSKITVPMAASENEIDTSSNTELSSSPKPKRKCTVSKKIENNSTEILVSKSTKDKNKIFYTKANNEEKPNAFNIQSLKASQSSTNLEAEAQQNSTNLKTDTQKTRKYIRKSTETVTAMPVLEPLSWQEADSETPSTDTGDILSSSEGDISQKQPAKVRRRRSSVEKIKDIPTRSSAILLQETPAPLDLKAVGTSGNLNEPTVLENNQPVWKNKVPVPPKPRKRRTKSSHELLPQSESTVNVPQENEVASKTDVGKVKKAKRKRASSMSNIPGVEAENLKNPLRVNAGGASKNVSAKSPKKNSEGQKRKKNTQKDDDMHDLKCVDCGLRFGSVASLEDHQQDCVTIAFEMSLMEAEDHLFECPHCHLTFALKGTQRKHTTSCRLAKSKKTPHRNDVKAMKRMNRTAAAPQEPLLPDAADSSLVANPCQGAPVKSRRRSKENVASEEGVNAASPLKDSFKQNFVNISEVADKSDSEKQVEKSKKLTPIPYSKSNSKVRKELQTNGQLENFEGVDLFCLTKIDDVQKCLVCGYEVSDKESVDKHRLLQQFTHHCQQKTVIEVCALLTNYNLSIDTVRTLITSANILHGSTVLNLDAKQQSYAENNSVTTVSANSCALQLKELLTSPHCTRILSVLDTIASHHRTSRTVSISGTRQEALKAVTALEELLKEISEIDNSIKKNRMLKSMRETFEAGTIN
ncbi:uncharacterized protein LOC125043219 [Penaeus chinensis]|uniref:uncharacterized protein LOC125043219 n=1 Tax=Penaeus chinensis TaxID=139456 RepID=UPI001FB8288A|nr:uncharacterized protein LOC125043219 [Penaeus chinensis]